MRDSDFIFDWLICFIFVNLFYYKCHKISFKRGGSDIDSVGWIKKKKVTINPRNSDDKWFQCAVTIALNFNEIQKDQQEFQILSHL